MNWQKRSHPWFLFKEILGTTGTPLLKRLHLGGSIRICSVGHKLLDGTAFIGTGILPDLFVEETWEDYVCGKDAALEKALEYLNADQGKKKFM